MGSQSKIRCMISKLSILFCVLIFIQVKEHDLYFNKLNTYTSGNENSAKKSASFMVFFENLHIK